MNNSFIGVFLEILNPELFHLKPGHSSVVMSREDTRYFLSSGLVTLTMRTTHPIGRFDGFWAFSIHKEEHRARYPRHLKNTSKLELRSLTEAIDGYRSSI